MFFGSDRGGETAAILMSILAGAKRHGIEPFGTAATVAGFYLSRAVDQPRAEGHHIADDMLSHVAPLGWEHISLTGDCVWTSLDALKGSFRPLHTGTSPFLLAAQSKMLLLINALFALA